MDKVVWNGNGSGWMGEERLGRGGERNRKGAGGAKDRNTGRESQERAEWLRGNCIQGCRIGTRC